MAEHDRHVLIRFHKPVPANVDGENGDTVDAVHRGATHGILDRETGRVYPFPRLRDAREALVDFPDDLDPASAKHPWEPHSSAEYDEDI